MTQAEQVYAGNGGVGEPSNCPRLIVTVTGGCPRFVSVPLPPQATISTLRRKRRKIAPHFRYRAEGAYDFLSVLICQRIKLLSPLTYCEYLQ